MNCSCLSVATFAICFMAAITAFGHQVAHAVQTVEHQADARPSAALLDALREQSIAAGKEYLKKARHARTDARTAILAKALKEFQFAHELDRDNVEAMSGLGEALYEFGHYDKAVLYFERAAAREPENSEHAKNSAACYFMLRDYSKALAVYSDIAQKQPASPEALRGMALCNQNMNRFDLAEEYFRQAIATGRHYYEARIDYAYFLLVFSVNPDAALKEYAQAVEIDPKRPEAYYGRYLAYKMLRNDNEAQRNRAEALKLDPEYETRNAR